MARKGRSKSSEPPGAVQAMVLVHVSLLCCALPIALTRLVKHFNEAPLALQGPYVSPNGGPVDSRLLAPVLIFALVYFPTWFRFLVGNIRYVAAHYGFPGITKKTNYDICLKRQLFDSFFLAFWGCLFCLLGMKICDLGLFMAIHTLLMVSDLPWLAVNLMCNERLIERIGAKQDIRTVLRKHRDLLDLSKALRRWLRNNATTFFLLLAIQIPFHLQIDIELGYYLLAFLAAGVLNSVIDIKSTPFIYAFNPER